MQVPSEVRGVLARNFPAAWVGAAGRASLPQKIQSLLQRIGPLDGLPVLRQGHLGLEATAVFQTASAAADAVKTLHGTDLRTPAEKKAVNGAPPKDSERFWLQADKAVVPAVPVAAAASAAEAPPKKRLKANGIFLSPLPPSWAENDVQLLATPYGSVQKIRVEALSTGQKGAYIDYHKDSAAPDALAGLDGLQLMGNRLRCVMQEEPEPQKPTQRHVFYLDELPMPARPEVDPRLDDRELFLTDLPRTARTEDAARAWLAGFGEVEEVFLLRDARNAANGKAYARFRAHAVAVAALKAIRATTADASQQVTWSESERASRGTSGPYGLDVFARISARGNARLREICQAAGASSLALVPGGATAVQQQAHFIVNCEYPAQAERCAALLSQELQKVHEAYAREVRGSLVLRGFPASWSEKGMKFVFAPFGGLSSVALEEERPMQGAPKDAAPSRLAYVKLRNAAATEKAVSNLHQTKVGDGDLLEECVVACHRWYLRAWSDETFRVTIFLDQLTMNRRPLEAGPGLEDRELFVRNLPLQDMNRQQLQEYFEGFGEVEDLHLITDVFTNELVGEGYVRFKQHRDAKRCIEALIPDHEAEPNDLTGTWSESERALQRKANCYAFNLISELVAADGSGLERLRTDAKAKSLWLMSESLRQKDRAAPPTTGRQLHFVARCTDEAHVQLLRELLEQALEDVHTRISDRLERRKRKAEAAAAAEQKERAAAAEKAAAAAAVTAAMPPLDAAAAPNGQAWHSYPPPSYWGAWRPPMAAPGGGQTAGQVPPGYPAAPGWGRPPATAPGGPPVSVFEQRPEGQDQAAGGGEKEGLASEEKKRSRSRRRKHRGEDKGKERERRHRSGSRKRRRRRDRSGSGGGGGGGSGQGGAA